MFKFKRRQLLKGILTAGVAVAQSSLASAETVDRSNQELRVLPSFEDRENSALATLPDRTLAHLLLECCELAQNHGKSNFQKPSKHFYLAGDRYTPTAFSTPLSAYSPQFHGVVLKDSERSAMMGTSGGMALTSDRHNIIALQTAPQEAKAPKSQAALVMLDSAHAERGHVYNRLKQLHNFLNSQVLAAAQQFDPALPCYITGYSVAGAIAPLAALEIAQQLPLLRSQIQVYTYGAPAVGDRAFAQFYNSVLPQTQRIVNLADLLPALLPTDEPIGKERVYLNQRGSVELNHAIETYKLALS